MVTLFSSGLNWTPTDFGIWSSRSDRAKAPDNEARSPDLRDSTSLLSTALKRRGRNLPHCMKMYSIFDSWCIGNRK